MNEEQRKAWEKKWNALEDDAMRQLSMAATAERFPIIVAAGSEMRRLRSEKSALHEAYTIQLRENDRLRAIVAKVEDVEGMEDAMDIVAHQSNASGFTLIQEYARAVRDYLLGRG